MGYRSSHATMKGTSYSCVVLVSLVSACAASTLPRQNSEPAAAAADAEAPEVNDTPSWSLNNWFQSPGVRQAVSVLFPNGQTHACDTSDGSEFRQGLCVRLADCPYNGGVRHGSCAGGIGSCCVFAKKCSQSTSEEVSHFISTGPQTRSEGSGECKLTINPMHSNICQYRFDMEDFEIEGPNAASECVYDFFTINGGSHMGKLCGKLTGQHLYINAKPGSGAITLTIDTHRRRKAIRNYKIKVTQIACDSPYKVPGGCLQYHNRTSGNVQSFNFPRAITNETGTGQIGNTQYGICIEDKVGYCDLTWTASEAQGDDAFTISNDSGDV